MNFLEDSKMECIEARALKSSVLSQMAAVNPDHANSQPLFNCNDDVWCLAAFNSSDDPFPVDDLLNLDFPDKDIIHDACFSQFDAAAAAAADHQTNSNSNSNSNSDSDSNYSSTTFSAADELAVPPDDWDNLEWLSQFVDDDTPPGLSLLCPIESFTNRGSANRGKRIDTLNRPVQNMRVPFLASLVPRKARSERLTRPSGRRPWFLAAAPPPMSAAESSTTTSSNGSSVLPPPPLFEKPAVLEQDWFYSVEKPPAKKQRKAPEEDSGRRCTHCQVDKTPQWRTGPRGPKTLCNACGVRYKSGRLFPEYRPACSPTFSKEAHSNSHRRVLEMRRKKEMTQGCEPGSTWPIRNC